MTFALFQLGKYVAPEVRLCEAVASGIRQKLTNQKIPVRHRLALLGAQLLVLLFQPCRHFSFRRVLAEVVVEHLRGLREIEHRIDNLHHRIKDSFVRHLDLMPKLMAEHSNLVRVTIHVQVDGVRVFHHAIEVGS